MRLFWLFLMVMGCSSAWAGEIFPPRAVLPFTGVWDLKAGTVDLSVDIPHMPTFMGDVAASLTARFELAGRDPLSRELGGEILTRYALLNYKPVRDVHIKFAVRDGRLSIDPLWFGALSGRGSMELAAPHTMDVALELLSADLEGFFGFFAVTGMQAPPLSGVVTGSMLLKGPVARPAVTGRLQAYNGRIKGSGYESIDLRFTGTLPTVRFEEGKVVALDGPSFKVGGTVDFSDASRLMAQIRQLKREFIVSEDGRGRSWTFKLNSSDGHSTQLKSFMSADTDDRREGAGIIGFQKNIGF